MPKDFTPHHLSRHTIPHHTTIAQHSTSHYYIPHVLRHISQTFNVATHLISDHHILHLRSHYTAVCLGTTIKHHHISKHMFHITHSPHLTPFHIHNYSTPHLHSASQHISHHTIFHIALHNTRFHIALHHHILTVYITAPLHLTSQHIASFSTSDVTLQSHSTLHITTIPHHYDMSHRRIITFHILHYGNISTYRTPHSTPRHIPHHTFCISVKSYLV